MPASSVLLGLVVLGFDEGAGDPPRQQVRQRAQHRDHDHHPPLVDGGEEEEHRDHRDQPDRQERRAHRVADPPGLEQHGAEQHAQRHDRDQQGQADGTAAAAAAHQLAAARGEEREGDDDQSDHHARHHRGDRRGQRRQGRWLALLADPGRLRPAAPAPARAPAPRPPCPAPGVAGSSASAAPAWTRRRRPASWCRVPQPCRESPTEAGPPDRLPGRGGAVRNDRAPGQQDADRELVWWVGLTVCWFRTSRSHVSRHPGVMSRVIPD